MVRASCGFLHCHVRLPDDSLRSLWVAPCPVEMTVLSLSQQERAKAEANAGILRCAKNDKLRDADSLRE